MRARLEDVSEKLSQLYNELREEGFRVDIDEKKTVLKIEVGYRKTEIAEMKIRKNSAKAIAKAVDVLQSILLMSDSIKKLFKLANALYLNLKIDIMRELKLFKEYYRVVAIQTLRIKHEFDIPRLKNFLDERKASVSTLSLREHAKQRLRDLEELTEVAEITYKYDYSSTYEIRLINFNELMRALSELKRIKDNYSEYRQAVNALVQLVSDYIKAANKLTTKDNSEYLKRKKMLRELELRALEAGDYDKVSDETLKQFIKSTFIDRAKKIKILDKSTKYRAILFCTLEKCQFCLVPAQYYLCGEDDNGEEWLHTVYTVDVSEYEYCSACDELYRKTVEWAEAWLLDISTSFFERFIDRQGDVFVFRDDEQTDYKEQEETDEFEILPNHTLKLSETAVIKYKRKRNRIYIDLPVPAILEHPSHHHVQLPPAKYIFVYVVSSHDQPVD